MANRSRHGRNCHGQPVRDPVNWSWTDDRGSGQFRPCFCHHACGDAIADTDSLSTCRDDYAVTASISAQRNSHAAPWSNHCSSAVSVHFVCELLDRFVQSRHCQWLDRSGSQTSTGVLDLTRPDAAVAPGRSADHGKRLVIQCTVTPATRQPVDCVISAIEGIRPR